MADVAIVIPLKSFDVAKERLRRAGTLDASDIARRLAAGVIEASAPRHVVILSESKAITNFARDLGAEVLESNARDLNEAVALGYRELGRRFDLLVLVHGDLATPGGLGAYEPEPGITIFTDRHQRGTNVLVVPTGLDFHFSYGPDSKHRHEAEAARLAQSVRVITSSPWALDIDESEDLALGQKNIQGGPEAPLNTRPRTD
jgi:2-phospho-L-lactate guanylyltransferase